MKTWITSVAILVAWVGVSSASAQCNHGNKANSDQGAAATSNEKGGSCSKAKVEGAQACKDADKAACQEKTLAAAGVPAMQYKVGDQTTRCAKQAGQWADGDTAKIRFVVGEGEFTDKAEALQAYAKVLDNHLTTMTTVRYAVGEKCVACPLAAGAMAKASGAPMKYRVASATFANKADADKAAAAAREAAGKVTTPALAEGAKPPDEASAKVELAKARIAAAEQAVEALAVNTAGDTAVAGA